MRADSKRSTGSGVQARGWWEASTEGDCVSQQSEEFGVYLRLQRGVSQGLGFRARECLDPVGPKISSGETEAENPGWKGGVECETGIPFTTVLVCQKFQPLD